VAVRRIAVDRRIAVTSALPGFCGIGSSGFREERCPSLVDYVTVMEPADRALAPGGC